MVQDVWPVGFGLLGQNLAFAMFVEAVPDVLTDTDPDDSRPDPLFLGQLGGGLAGVLLCLLLKLGNKVGGPV